MTYVMIKLHAEPFVLHVTCHQELLGKNGRARIAAKAHFVSLISKSGSPPASLPQVQATVVGFLAAVAAVVLGWIPEGKFQMSHAVLLCSSSVATAFIASLLQGKYTHCDAV